MDDRPQNHPSRDLAAADQRPATRQAEAAVDDVRLPRGTGTVGRDYIQIVMDGVRRLRRELSCGPMRIAIPYAPRNRRVGFCQFLEYRDAVHRCQVEPAIGRRQKNAKKPRAREVACEISRQPSGCFDSVALRDYTRLEIAGSCNKSGAVAVSSCMITPEHSNEDCYSPAGVRSAPARHASAGRPRPITSNTRTLASLWESFVSV